MVTKHNPKGLDQDKCDTPALADSERGQNDVPMFLTRKLENCQQAVAVTSKKRMHAQMPSVHAASHSRLAK